MRKARTRTLFRKESQDDIMRAFVQGESGLNFFSKWIKGGHNIHRNEASIYDHFLERIAPSYDGGLKYSYGLLENP